MLSRWPSQKIDGHIGSATPYERAIRGEQHYYVNINIIVFYYMPSHYDVTTLSLMSWINVLGVGHNR